MPLEKVEEEKPVDPKTAKELAAEQIESVHRDNVTWLRNNGFTRSFVEADKGCVAYKTATNYGNFYILLYDDCEVRGEIDTQHDFFSEETADLNKTLENELKKVITQFNEGIQTLESKIAEKQRSFKERVNAVCVDGVALEGPLSIELETGDGYKPEVVDDLRINLKTDYCINIEKGTRSAEEVYKLMETTISALEGIAE